VQRCRLWWRRWHSVCCENLLNSRIVYKEVTSGQRAGAEQ
jgi:hypothetical protein